jgi:hypothetical protein
LHYSGYKTLFKYNVPVIFASLETRRMDAEVMKMVVVDVDENSR